MATFETCENCGEIINTNGDDYVSDDDSGLIYHEYCYEPEPEHKSQPSNLIGLWDAPISTRWEHLFIGPTSPYADD